LCNDRLEIISETLMQQFLCFQHKAPHLDVVIEGISGETQRDV